MKNKAVVLALSLLASTSVTAQPPTGYVLKSVNRKGSQYWIHVQSVRKTTENIARAWVITNYTERTSDGTFSYREYGEYDCQQGRMRGLETTYFRDQWAQNPKNTDTVTEDWNYVPPGSSAEEVLTSVCSMAGINR